MSFIGKETFREGNIWLEEGAIAGLPFSPYLYAYQEDGGTYTKVDAPPVPVSAESTTWFGFTYQVSLPETFTSADGDPSQFSLTALDVTERGGAFIDYGDGNGPVPMGAPDDLVGFAKGTSDDYPEGTSVTWLVLDADLVTIGERTIPFGTEAPASGPFSAQSYLLNTETMTWERVDGAVVASASAPVALMAAPTDRVPTWPATLSHPAEYQAILGTVHEVVAAGGSYVAANGIKIAGPVTAASTDGPIMATQFGSNVLPALKMGIYEDAEFTQPVWESAAVPFTMA